MVSWYVPGCNISLEYKTDTLDHGTEGGSERAKELSLLKLGAE